MNVIVQLDALLDCLKLTDVIVRKGLPKCSKAHVQSVEYFPGRTFEITHAEAHVRTHVILSARAAHVKAHTHEKAPMKARLKLCTRMGTHLGELRSHIEARVPRNLRLKLHGVLRFLPQSLRVKFHGICTSINVRKGLRLRRQTAKKHINTFAGLSPYANQTAPKSSLSD